MKFYTYIKEPIKKKIPSKFSKKIKVVEFKSNDLKMFMNLYIMV